jgi:hypothetical protein
MNRLNKLFQEMIDAGQRKKLPSLNMTQWHCSTSCCSCGDVAIARNKRFPKSGAIEFSNELDDASKYLLDEASTTESVYGASYDFRLCAAKLSSVLKVQDRNHPHLNCNHDVRAILHDYIRLVMLRVNERLSTK